MDFEGYETILIIVAIVATGIAIIYALGRSDESANGVTRDDAPSRADLAPADSAHVPPSRQSADHGNAGISQDNKIVEDQQSVRDDNLSAEDGAQTASAPTDTEAPDDIAATDEARAAGRASSAPRPRASSPSRSGSARRTAKPAPARSSASLGERSVGGRAEIDATESDPDPAGEAVVAGVEAPSGAPEQAAKPQTPDDLTRIRGIGRGIAGKLNAMGVVSFAQMAAWTPDDLRRIDAALAFPGRAQRENWVGQAKALAAGKAGPGGGTAGGL